MGQRQSTKKQKLPVPGEPCAPSDPAPVANVGDPVDESDADVPWTTVNRLAAKTPFSTLDVLRLFHKFHAKAQESEDPDALHENQLRELLQETGFDIEQDAFIEGLFQHFDKDKSGKLSFLEFVLGLSILAHGSIRDKIALSFEVYDRHNDGFITKPEMINILKLLDHKATDTAKREGAQPHLTPEERDAEIDEFVNQVFEKYDRERNGQLFFHEYMRALMNHPALVNVDFLARRTHESPDDSKASTPQPKRSPSPNTSPQQSPSPKLSPTPPVSVNTFEGMNKRDWVVYGVKSGWLIEDAATGTISFK